MRKTIPQNKHKKPNHFHRKLHIGDEVWSYQLASNGVYIRHPDGLKTTFVNNKDMDWVGDWEEEEDWDMDYYIPKTPSDVKEYIKKNLHPNTTKRQEPEVIRKR